MNNYTKTVGVGIFFLLGIAVFFGGSLWLRGRSLGSRDLAIIFKDIGTLKEGSPVRISGAAIGRVETIEYQAPGRVLVGVKFGTHHIVPTKNATAAITAVGMLGDAVIDLDPGTGPPLANGETISGTMTTGIFDKAGGLVDVATKTLTSANNMLDHELIVDLRRTLATTEKLEKYLTDATGGPISQIGATMAAFQTTSAHLDTTLATLDGTMTKLDPKTLQARLDSTMHSAGNAADSLASLTSSMKSLMNQIQHGNGTLGKLASDTMMYVDLRKLLAATTKLIDELAKNPGKIGITIRIP